MRGVELPTVHDEPTALHCFGRDLTELVRAGRFAPQEGCEPWVSRVFEILTRPPNYRYNPLLLVSSEAEGRPIVAEVVRRIAGGEVPAGLGVRQVVALDWKAVVRDLPAAGESESWGAPEHRWYTKEEVAAEAARGQPILRGVPVDDDHVEHRRADPIDQLDNPIYDPIHQRIEAVFAEARRSDGRVLLYVEQLQRLFGGEQEPYPVDMRDLLKPAFGRGELRILGRCSLDAYWQHIERD